MWFLLTHSVIYNYCINDFDLIYVNTHSQIYYFKFPKEYSNVRVLATSTNTTSCVIVSVQNSTVSTRYLWLSIPQPTTHLFIHLSVCSFVQLLIQHYIYLFFHLPFQCPVNDLLQNARSKGVYQTMIMDATVNVEAVSITSINSSTYSSINPLIY